MHLVKCKKDQHGDIHQKWSLLDPTSGARTIEENQRIGEQSRKQYNICFKSSPIPKYSFEECD